MSLHIYKDADTLSFAAAQWIVDCIQHKLKDHDRFTWLFSGGNTPKQLYQLLSTERFKNKIDWSKLHIFFGDERVVPFDDERNNGKMAKESLLAHIAIPSNQIHFINTEVAIDQSVSQYEKLLHHYFDGKSTTFDIALLGMGDDAHTLSLFPGSPLIHEHEKWVVSLYLPSQQMYRISLMPSVINGSDKTMFLISGVSKATALKNVLNSNYQPERFPAKLIRPINNELHWFIDEPAGKEL